MLQHVPRGGLQLLDDITRTTLHRKVVVVRRGWSDRIVYRITRDELVVEFIDPSSIVRRSLERD